VAILARHHHEWVNGDGYPDAKRKDQIPLGARIIAVADAFDAMMSDRPYRKCLPLAGAIGEIREYADRHFDPEIARAFFRVLRRDLNGARGKESVLDEKEGGRARGEALGLLDRTLQEWS